MKITIWDILAILGLVLLCLVSMFLLAIFANPYSALNPFPPPTLPATVVIPSSTPTLRSLPPTWTPAGTRAYLFPSATLANSSTPGPSPTGFTMPTFTPTSTVTNTPTVTPTITVTRTITRTPTRTRTRTPKPTKTPTVPPPPTSTATTVPSATPTP